MAKSPNKKPIRRRRKKAQAKPKVQKGPAEFAGFTLGQEVWCRMDIYGTVEYAFGTIYCFHPKDSVEPSFSFFDKVRKRYATGAISKIVDRPPKKWMSKAR